LEEKKLIYISFPILSLPNPNEPNLILLRTKYFIRLLQFSPKVRWRFLSSFADWVRLQLIPEKNQKIFCLFFTFSLTFFVTLINLQQVELYVESSQHTHNKKVSWLRKHFRNLKKISLLSSGQFILLTSNDSTITFIIEENLAF
jgi:WD40 repeat protein